MNKDNKLIKDLSFEKAFERLELILELLNNDKASLDESLTLFEEANTLIKKCDSFLSSAQQKVETLIKNRNGSILLDENQVPKTSDFSSNKETVFQNPSQEIPF